MVVILHIKVIKATNIFEACTSEVLDCDKTDKTAMYTIKRGGKGQCLTALHTNTIKATNIFLGCTSELLEGN